MQSARVIVLATPVFLGLIAVEFWVARARGRNVYRLNDALSSIGLGVLSQLAGVFAAAFTLGVYVGVFEHGALWRLPADAAWVWVVGLVAYDFCYYWHHRFGHTCALLWAAHAVHHQSEDYNLSTALRQTSTGWLFGWLFYLPMAVLGFSPLVFASVALIDLLYQYWVHTQLIGRLGWFDRWFCSPSNHRVHHAVNDRYLDKNFGGILILWDRLFGSFAEEDDAEPCVYGTRKPLASFDPVKANLQMYAALLGEMRAARRWRDRLALAFKPPGWRPAELRDRFGPHRFVLADVRRYDPPARPARRLLAAALFLALLGAAAAWLWRAHELEASVRAAAALAIAAGLVGVAWLSEGRARALPDESTIIAARSRGDSA